MAGRCALGFHTTGQQCHPQNLRQLARTNAMIKTAAPQILSSLAM